MTIKNTAFKRDLKKYYLLEKGTESFDILRTIERWLNSFGLHCVAIYRFGQWASFLYKKNKILGVAPVVLHRALRFIIVGIYHVDIDGATIGPGLYIGHVGTIYIGPCIIGDNFSITHNITIGFGYSNNKEGVPEIGNNVWIGTGSILTGKITIGNNVTILPGSVISHDIPDQCLVGGNPGRVLMQNYDNKKLFEFRASEKTQ